MEGARKLSDLKKTKQNKDCFLRQCGRGAQEARVLREKLSPAERWGKMALLRIG